MIEGRNRPHKRLKVWQKSMELVKNIYAITKKFPSEEKYALASQMQRAAVSIASNISEGAARNTNKDKVHFYYIARGSISELDTQLEISFGVKYITNQELETTLQVLYETSSMLQGLIKSVKDKQ